MHQQQQQKFNKYLPASTAAAVAKLQQPVAAITSSSKKVEQHAINTSSSKKADLKLSSKAAWTFSVPMPKLTRISCPCWQVK